VKILSLDIETRPALGYIWSLWDQNVGLSQLVVPTEMLCFAARFVGEKKMHFHSTWSDGKAGMVEAAHALLDQADAVLTYNGKTFDVPHLNREMALAGLTPPSPYAHIDLYVVAKGQFRFISNKLEHVAEQFGVGTKIKHDGFGLWRRVLADDPKAQKSMEKYNKHDVVLLEGLYPKVKPWIKGHPNVALIDGEGTCPTCGSDNMQRRGFSHTQTGKFQRWVCLDCGTWHRSGKRVEGSDLRRDAAA
jgi:hypothetical protein